MKRLTKPDIAPSGYEIRVGYVTPFVVVEVSGGTEHCVGCDTRVISPVAAFHTLNEARSHFPSAKVSDGVERKARELGK